MKVDLRKFFDAYEGTPHQIAGVQMLSEIVPVEMLDKFCDWVICFEQDGEVDPLPPDKHKGYNIDVISAWDK